MAFDMFSQSLKRCFGGATGALQVVDAHKMARGALVGAMVAFSAAAVGSEERADLKQLLIKQAFLHEAAGQSLEADEIRQVLGYDHQDLGR